MLESYLEKLSQTLSGIEKKKDLFRLKVRRKKRRKKERKERKGRWMEQNNELLRNKGRRKEGKK